MKNKYLMVIITLALFLNGCSLDGWTSLGFLDDVASKATGNNNSGPTPIPTKSPETIEKEKK